jgi:FAD/FMN-containing dehydrogenase
MSGGFDGEMLDRGHEGYERARRAAVWNGRTPERYPQLIVRAAGEADVVRAVLMAGELDMRISVRSGGHSWAGNHLRDGGMLIDLSSMNRLTVHAAGMSAVVEPGCVGRELAAELAAHELFFPAGHCSGVAVGGYLLQGGFGWNGRVHGPACMSVQAVDLVTADGRSVHANEDENPDLLWAARGAGPGFFAVVTRFHICVAPRPAVVANGIYLYPIDLLEDVLIWAHEISPRIPRMMELMLLIHRRADGELEIALTGPVLAAGEREADEALALLARCPVAHLATAATPNVRVELDDLFQGVHLAYPDGHRFAADNMWTHAPACELLPPIRRIAETMPPSPSHMLWMNWGPGATPAPPRPDMAYSVEDDTYIALYGVWTDAAQDDANVSWVTDRMREMEPLASGIQLADENLGRRPARFVTGENLARLDDLRAQHDPHGRFHEWMGRPVPAGP